MGVRAVAATLFVTAFMVVFTSVQPYMQYEGLLVYIWDTGLLGITAWRVWLFTNVLVTVMMGELTAQLTKLAIPPVLWFIYPQAYSYFLLAQSMMETFMAANYFYPIPLAYILLGFPVEQWLIFWPYIRNAVLSYAAFSCIWSIYFLLFQVLAAIALITGVFFVIKVKTKFLFSSFAAIQAAFGLAALTGHVSMGTPLTSSFLTANVFFQQILFGGVQRALTSFLTSPLFLSALACYLYVEAGLLLIYMMELVSPITERGRRVERQLRIVDELVNASTMLELGERVSLSKEAKEFLEKMTEMKIFSKPEAAKMEALHDLRRLKAYVEQIYLEIPDSRETLSARAAMPEITPLIRSSLTGIALRVCGVIALSFICFTVLFVLRQIGAPLPIIESIEVVQPEIVLILLLPIVFSFSMAATVIRAITKRGKERTEEGK
nr:hypothetical protein [Candidatus Bathyarchaeota archaeon]